MTGATQVQGRCREYICHLQLPRFVARIVVCNEDGTPVPSEQPVDRQSGIVYSVKPEVLLCEIAWIDIVDQVEARRWLESAAACLTTSKDSR